MQGVETMKLLYCGIKDGLIGDKLVRFDKMKSTTQIYILPLLPKDLLT